MSVCCQCVQFIVPLPKLHLTNCAICWIFSIQNFPMFLFSVLMVSVCVFPSLLILSYQAALFGCGCWAQNSSNANPYSTAVSTSGIQTLCLYYAQHSKAHHSTLSNYIYHWKPNICPLYWEQYLTKEAINPPAYLYFRKAVFDWGCWSRISRIRLAFLLHAPSPCSLRLGIDN